MELCDYKKTNYTPASPYSPTTSYSKRVSYKTATSSPECYKNFKDGVFMENVQPNTRVNQDYCKTNNMCKDNQNYVYLNQRGVEISPFFVPSDRCGYKSIQADGRLYDVPRGYKMELDTPPIQVVYDSKHDNISGKSTYPGYDDKYRDYASVKGGQIQYYISKDIAQPFFSPVYSMPSQTKGYMYTDPMGTKRPQFEKTFDNTRMKHTNMLSFVEDTTKFRDDIISLQQQKNNESRYDLMYVNNMTK
jgi:hypothetical protein